MRPVVLFGAREGQREDYRAPLARAAAAGGLDLEIHMDPAEVDPARVDYLIFAANGAVTDFTPYTRIRAILNLWAGVEAVLALDLPENVPLVRMVEDGLTLGMIDYVVGHTLRHHLDLDRFVATEPLAQWVVGFPPLARDRTVGILGLGELGAACATALSGLGFDVHGWSRSPKQLPGVACHHGAEGLFTVLGRAEILTLLLPQTPATERMIDAGALARMPMGACLINAARGPLIDNDALLEALDRGHLHHATLDVFDVEPLPDDHPFWRHPKVTVTPHIASATRPETASLSIMQNIARDLAGGEMLHIVDRKRGY